MRDGLGCLIVVLGLVILACLILGGLGGELDTIVGAVIL